MTAQEMERTIRKAGLKACATCFRTLSPHGVHEPEFVPATIVGVDVAIQTQGTTEMVWKPRNEVFVIGDIR